MTAMLHQGVLYIVEDLIGYFLMLAVMTYNAYLAIGVFIGSGLGYFVFGIALGDGVTARIQRCQSNREDMLKQEEERRASLLSEVAEGIASALNTEEADKEEPLSGHATEHKKECVVEVHTEDSSSAEAANA